MIDLKKSLILASNSPRRKQLLHDAGFAFTVEVLPTDESYPADLPAEEVAGYISREKAEQFRGIRPDSLVLTADTVVIAEHHILGKPTDAADAFRMIRILSGRSHKVVTAVSLLSDDIIETTSDVAEVYFRDLEDWEINHYIEQYKPFDKAGSYGIQEWIGMVGIEKIEGSFYTIMGLPVQVVYRLLKPHFQ
ncbi:septum formation protein [Dyadobacter sp. BE34]|uniref:dTTP/UTP pyrophosphatase n=1 Tax=Dyadobacter fermentans TaxID=94254 RepID=A0ABU1R1Y6_9BACT|nr:MULTISPECIES: Maf family nucleotide pyrophosphatase [Dyadobacter]MDR6807427.1 septum formation protein [Dyadobacter fermentans]MDR7045168.1 septum formation protein [Dyadobacter sp. BE242]MDR7199095.1 septum formation protein [Dyadobacter sp. BE34]MDR7217055.1 septum formation protein [Dyadobacter sp. BE31]MDR7264988.1 septum formation protein [Dyadobacter sp. BE32]